MTGGTVDVAVEILTGRGWQLEALRRGSRNRDARAIAGTGALRSGSCVVTSPRSRSKGEGDARGLLDLRPRFRLLLGEEGLFGPGKADLLAAIRCTGSVRLAAGELGMSYMRAWRLVRAMNEAFREPLVVLSRGGAARGGARLSPLGEEVLALYRQIEAASRRAVARPWRRLKFLLS